MRTLEDYEYRIDHLHWDGLMKCKLYNYLKEKVGNLIGRKFEHELFLEDEKALDLRENFNPIVEDNGIDVTECAYLLDFLSHVGK